STRTTSRVGSPRRTRINRSIVSIPKAIGPGGEDFEKCRGFGPAHLVRDIGRQTVFRSQPGEKLGDNRVIRIKPGRPDVEVRNERLREVGREIVAKVINRQRDRALGIAHSRVLGKASSRWLSMCASASWVRFIPARARAASAVVSRMIRGP